MAQVAYSDRVSGKWESATTTPSVTLPAGDEGDHQLLVITTSNAAAAAPPVLSGWTRTVGTLGVNQLIVYHRVLSADVAAQASQQLQFGASCVGCWSSSSRNGTISDIQIQTAPNYSQQRTIPAANAGGANAKWEIFEASASFPRSSPAIAGITEHSDDYSYSSATTGIWLVHRSKDVGAGSTGAATYTMRNEADNADAADQTMILSFVTEELLTTSDALFDVLGEFPTITLTASASPLAPVIGEIVTVTHDLQGSTQGVDYGSLSGGVEILGPGQYRPTEVGQLSVTVYSIEAPSVSATVQVYAVPPAPVVIFGAAQASPVSLSGTGHPGSTVIILADGDEVATATVDAQGNWSSPSVTLAAGQYDITASQAKYGYQSASTSAQTLTVEDPATDAELSGIGLTINPVAPLDSQSVTISVGVYDQFGQLFGGQAVTLDVVNLDTQQSTQYGPQTATDGTTSFFFGSLAAGRYEATASSGAINSPPLGITVRSAEQDQSQDIGRAAADLARQDRKRRKATKASAEPTERQIQAAAVEVADEIVARSLLETLFATAPMPLMDIAPIPVAPPPPPPVDPGIARATQAVSELRMRQIARTQAAFEALDQMLR